MREKHHTILFLSATFVAITVASSCGEETTSDGSSSPTSDVRSRRDAGETDETGIGGTPTEDCRENGECSDENPCTSDFCNGGECFHTPNDVTTPTQIIGNCREELCEEGVLLLVEDLEDVPPEDDHECTNSRCEAGEVVFEVDNAFCDNGNRCDGIEICDVESGCREGPPADYDEDGVADSDDPDPPDADDDGITDCADWETCDGIDNDHNGFVDDDPQDAVLGNPCYDGPEGTSDVGQCVPGARACLGGRIVCTDQVLPETNEYCDGIDNDCDGAVPEEEIEDSCTTHATFQVESTGPTRIRLEFPTELRLVDVHFNIDTTGSMSGALERLRTTLRTEIVPGVAEVIPEAAFGVSTFEDYPLSSFGSGSDLPFELWQRVTTRVDLVQDALAAITLGSGNDIPESGIESLYQAATGAGTRWPRRSDSSSYDPSTRDGFVGEIDPTGDVDFYRFEASVGDFLSVDIDASRIGSGIDGYLELYDSTGRLLTFNDDSDGLDPGLSITLSGVPPYFLKVRGLFSTSRGWYYAQVFIAGVAHLPAENTCSEIEVGLDVFAGTGRAIDLVPKSIAVPRPDPSACFLDCEANLNAPVAAAWIRSHCFAGGTETCGDSVLDEFEECDDGNRVSGDGCSGTCSLETEGVPRFAPELGYDPGLGHGVRGGAGFREDALPIIIHATDAGSHDQGDYLAYDSRIDAHGTEDTFHELEKLGARVIGLAARTPSDQPISDLLNPPGMAFRTGANVPPCAFDGSEPRTADPVRCAPGQCCVGENGAGRAPPAGGDGMCTLSFRIGGDGTGLTDGIIRGIQALARFATYTITPVFTDDPGNPRDGRCFIHSVQVAEVIQPEECVPQLEFADRDGDGFDESILNATPRTRVVFELEVENRDIHDFDGDLDTNEPCGPPGTYRVQMDLVGDDVTTLSSHELTFTIEE